MRINARNIWSVSGLGFAFIRFHLYWTTDILGTLGEILNLADLEVQKW